MPNTHLTATKKHTGWSKKLTPFVLYTLISSNIDRFSNLLHCQNQENICNNNVTKDPTTPQMRCYTTLVKCQCLKSNNWKEDEFCNKTF